MVIQVNKNGKQFYIQSKVRDRSPVITPFRSKAWTFTDLNKCLPIRDDVLEYFSNVSIVA